MRVNQANKNSDGANEIATSHRSCWRPARAAASWATDHKLAQRLGGATVLGTTLRHAIATQLPVVVVTTEALADVARRSVAARDVVVLPEVGSAGPSRSSAWATRSPPA